MALGKEQGKDLTLCDGLPARLPGKTKRIQLRMGKVLGMDTPFGGGKALAAGVNLSPRCGQEIASRLPRDLFVRAYGNGTPHGMTVFNGMLIFARGIGLFATSDGVTVRTLGKVSDTDKSFIIFGDRLYIYPDKIFLKRNSMPQPVELDTGVISQAQLSGNTLRLPAGTNWTDLGFEVGDCVKLVNEDDSEPVPEDYYRIQKINGVTATMAQSFPTTYTSDIRLLRVVPDLTACCVCGDRVYGIAGRNIHVSAAGSATDFYSRSTGDGSHAVTIEGGTEGDFTTLSPWQGYVVFFKSDRICKLLGNRADSFALQDRQGVGVPAELSKTLCAVGDALYYASKGGVWRYRGQEPEWICSLDGMTATGGCGGTDGRAYYLSVDTDGTSQTALYLPEEGKWYPEDTLSMATMLCRDDLLWMQDGAGRIWTTSSDGRSRVTSYDETGLIGPVTASVTLPSDRPETPARVRLSALWVRATGKGTGSLRVYVSYADGGASVDATREEEILLEQFASPMTERRLAIPLLAGACDAVTIRLEMTGEWIIHDVIRRYEVLEA